MEKPPEEKGGSEPLRRLTLSAALEGLPVGVLLLDAEGAVVEANSRMASLIGLPDEGQGAAGRHVSELLPEGSEKLMELLRSGEGSFGMQLPEMDKAHVVALPLSGGARGLSVTAADARTLGTYFGAMPAARAANRLFERTAAGYSEGLLVCDSAGSVVYVNDRAAELMGLARLDIEGKPASCLAGLLTAAEGIALEVLARGRQAAGRARCPRTGKTVFVSGAPVCAPDGEFSLAVFTVRDLGGVPSGERAAHSDRELFGAFRDEVTGRALRAPSGRSLARRSSAMQKTLESAARLARSGARGILITGEPGSGRESVALYIHERSPGSAEPFVRVSCSRRDPRDLEAEIFGIETPDGSLAGVLEAAGKGTVYLNDADLLPPPIQARLADHAEGRGFRRINGRADLSSEATVMLAVASWPAADGGEGRLPEEGRLSQGLLAALAAGSLAVPPLRSRREDIADIAREEVKSLNRRYGLSRFIDPAAADILASHSFPGNVRELRSVVHQAMIFSAAPNIGPYLGRHYRPGDDKGPRAAQRAAPLEDSEDDRLPDFQSVKARGLNPILDEIELRLLSEAAENCRSTREMAAVLGISQAGVSRKLKKFNLEAPGKNPRRFQGQAALT
ncbi:MAG: sigma 54-interacting transcriptional regulator [Deltaproteobacteria bacterium]|jgi:DNA-binding NtrC family response regulator|nr:sigma 54-interacting transcriptional regulator [Deltaproteobacteria bacterium]